MKLVRLFLSLLIVVLGSASVARANTVWTVNADFSYNQENNVASGNITLDSSLNVVSYDVTVSGTNTAADVTYLYVAGTPASSNGFPVYPNTSNIDLYDTGTGQYLNLYLDTPFTTAGGTITLSSTSLACAGCGTLTSGTLSTVASPTPEPSSIALLGTGVSAMAAFARRRKLLA